MGQRLCVVCQEKDRSHAPPCLHLCCCEDCCQVPSVARECPICRARVPDAGWRRVYV